MIVEFTDEQLPELKRLLNRALNTWDKPPKWALELDHKVSKLLVKHAEKPHEHGSSRK